MKEKNNYRIHGTVTSERDGRGIPNLRVEARDKDRKADDLLGSAQTDKDGKFTITFDKSHFKDRKLFPESQPDVYFNVFWREKLIRSTEDSILWDIDAGDKEVEIKVNMDSPVAKETLSFTVSGKTVTPTGEPVPRQALSVFEVNLLGAAVYRTVQTLAELRQNGGFEPLKELSSDSKGRYTFTFTIAQEQGARRKKANIIVFAVTGNEIIGRSVLVNSNQNIGQGGVRNLDVPILREVGDQTEYELLMPRLNRFLEESGVTLAQLAASQDQITFAARELEEDAKKIEVAARAELIRFQLNPRIKHYHQLFYGIGRQGIPLTWPSCFQKTNEQLNTALETSIRQKIIRSYTSKKRHTFLSQVRNKAVATMLDHKEEGQTKTVGEILSFALPQKEQRKAFMDSLTDFDGDNETFWKEYLPNAPAFKENPPLISRLLFSNQLILISGNHLPLVEELQVKLKLTGTDQLLELSTEQWENILAKTGVPEHIKGKDDKEKKKRYTEQIQNIIHAAFPTQKIALMVKGNELPIDDADTAAGVSAFLSGNKEFDISRSKISRFEEQIITASPDNHEQVKNELLTIQRIFQVSPTLPAMRILKEKGLNSAYTIAGIPEKSFIKMYSESLGGKENALDVHRKASHVAMRAADIGQTIYEIFHGAIPQFIMPPKTGRDPMFRSALLKDAMTPLLNYSELFGSPDICECKHCRSVYSPAAYFVDLLRFLWRGVKNADNKSPLDMFANRRPDLLHMPLTCENTHTLIPYIDLANEVMEYYVANDSLTNFEGFDTGEATAEELRANPQNVIQGAYEKLKDAVYPFTLPYHLPLYMIRTYSDHLGIDRHQVMTTMQNVQNDFPTPTKRAIEAETLKLSEEEYTILTKKKFDGTNDTEGPYVYFGYVSYFSGNVSVMEQLAKVPEFLMRSGMAYTDLVELLKTRFINPAQAGLDSIITLYQKESKCELDTTCLRTLKNVYDDTDASGINNETWSEMHRFIRLWRKLGWSIHELDLVFYSLGEDDITTETISKLSSVVLLNKQLKQPLQQLAVVWGDIDTYGEKSLYKKLFLNKAVRSIDPVFEADQLGNYPADNSELLVNHISGIRAAFRMTAEDFQAVLTDAGANLELTLANLSLIYRYTVLAKALKLSIPDFCLLIKLFNGEPFSHWDIQQEKYLDISPANTLEFCKLAADVKKSGFKPVVLQYIFTGNVPAESTLALDSEKPIQAAKSIRTAFTTIDQDYPDVPNVPITSEVVRGKLLLTCRPEVVELFMAILEGTSQFTAITDINLAVEIPMELKEKYSYIKGNGKLTCKRVMTDSEKDTLKALDGVTTNFGEAIDELYKMPEDFIRGNFYSVFAADMDGAVKELLRRSEPPSTTIEELEEKLNEKLQYVYKYFIPLLKKKLRKDAVVQHIAVLTGLSEAAAAVLVKDDQEKLLEDLSKAGYSATYFKDAVFNVVGKERIDSEIDFTWNDAPDSLVPADQFSVRWEALIAPPASADYTLVVDVRQTDESFNLYIDDALKLQKTAAETMLSWEYAISLDVSRVYRFKLEYAHNTQEAGIRLTWKTPTMGSQVIPSSSAFPAAVIDDLITKAAIYHRAAKFISGFQLNERELEHFSNFSGDFADIDFKALEAKHWERIYDYTTLRNGVPQAQALLTDVFALANRSNPSPTVDELREMLHLATAWDADTLLELLTYFQFVPDDFKNEVKLIKLHNVMKIISKTGASVETLKQWGDPASDFNTLNKTAQLIQNTVKAKYEEPDWLKLAAGLNDKIRKNRKQKLIQYLLRKPELRDWGVTDADSLFEYFLIDVQMGSCMDTSRIVQANSSIQLFVTRCLLNLESNLSSGVEKGVSPGYIDAGLWEWMKSYRVWEANRKIFLYPENWLEPEWRDDRSPFFRELESELVQNDITERSVETAFRNYLSNVNGVANLEVCGMYRDEETGNTHVFARTHNIPYKYFYRTWNKYYKWSAWEKVELDIRSVDAGEKSGVHLIPVVWKKRLFLFWPEFLEKPMAPVANQSAPSIEDMMTTQPLSALEPGKYWEVRLAWSEYVDGKWTDKQVTKEVYDFDSHLDLNEYFCMSFIQWGGECSIMVGSSGKYLYPKAFTFSDIQSRAEVEGGWAFSGSTLGYSNHFMKQKKDSELYSQNETSLITYLQSSIPHMLLYSNNLRPENFEPGLRYPFFYYNDSLSHTYFVRPVDIPLTECVQNPEHFEFISDTSGMFQQPTGSALHADISAQSAMKIKQNRSSEKIMDDTQPVGKPFRGITPSYDFEERALGHANLTFQSFLEFHTFYHPYSSQYITRLNQLGMDGLMASDTTIIGDNGTTFEKTYDPNWNHVRPKQLDLNTDENRSHTFYKENVCFDVYGANSIYNWELFFHAPLYIATRLSKNGKFEEAMKWFHYIFDPTTAADEMPDPGQEETSRCWKVLPFKTNPVKRLLDWLMSLSVNTNPAQQNSSIAEWGENPFNPDLIASNRPVAYMKNVVIKYVENLVSWGDSLFRRDTMESINEATQLYVTASQILGPRPQFVPSRGKIESETYASLEPKLNDFSNALVRLENEFPFSSTFPGTSTGSSGGWLGIGAALYFCIPQNEKLLDEWDTVADRLFKIRHCMNIDGVERSLALFEPPIDPDMLIQATAKGLNLSDILNDLSSPPPIYRFNYLIQKAAEFCAEVKSLGAALLSALEKKDSEELERMRAEHETTMLDSMTAIKERQVLEAKANMENLGKSRETAIFRMQHYLDLLGNDSIALPGIPGLSSNLHANSKLPKDTHITIIETDVDDSLVDSKEASAKLTTREKEDLCKSTESKELQEKATVREGIAGIMHFLPNMSISMKPFGLGIGFSFGGSNVGAAISATAKKSQIESSALAFGAAQALKIAGYIRRESDWTFQANLAAKEIIQLDKQITAAEIRLQSAEKELENHLRQIENSKEVEQFLKDKFTNQELYQWMKEQLYDVYKQSYNLAYNMAKKAEKACRYEIGDEMASFIQYGYWDNSYQGLMSGEKLSLALKQLENFYIEENKRELELTKHISMALLNPLALLELKETGKCFLNLPEELFDLDFQGHYFRRIKSVSLSIPCIAGPNTTVNCSLRLLKNTIRINTSPNVEGNYEHNNDEGVWTDDTRFRSSNVPVKSIAACTGQNDAGMFELNFRDERYLPFEGAGAISKWNIELTTEKDLRQFDYSTISDIIIHMKYTAREDTGLFKQKAVEYIKNFLMNAAELSTQPLMRMFSLKHEFPTEWHKFLHPDPVGGEQILNIRPGKERFPFFVQHRSINVKQVDIFARTTKSGDYYYLIITANDNSMTFPEIPMPESAAYGGLQKATLTGTIGGFNIEEISVDGLMALKLRHESSTGFTSLETAPDELKDILMVMHYRLGDE